MFLERSNFDSESSVRNAASHETQQPRPISYTETHASRTLLINNENRYNTKNTPELMKKYHIHTFSSSIIHEAAKLMYGNRYPLGIDDVEPSKNLFQKSQKKEIPVSYFLKCQMCKRKVEFQDSPVYTDRLIFNKQPLHAIEVILCQCDNSLYFGYHLEGNNSNTSSSCIDFMPVYNVCKTTSAGILYPLGLPQDIFDFKLLFTNIGVVKNEANTHLYHNNFYTRSSNSGCRPMRFSFDSSTSLLNNDDWELCDESIRTNCTKKIQLTSLHHYQSHRSSLLLLEPLLMNSDLKIVDVVYSKNRFSRSKFINLLRIIIVYIFLFFISIILILYVLYFAND